MSSIEFASIQTKVFDALKAGNTVLQAINAEVSIDEVEKLMDESAEAIEYQNVKNCSNDDDDGNDDDDYLFLVGEEGVVRHSLISYLYLFFVLLVFPRAESQRAVGRKSQRGG